MGDVLTALNQVIKNGMADPDKVSVMGGSHGGFMALHLLGQVSELVQVVSLLFGDEILDLWCFLFFFLLLTVESISC